MVETDRIPIQAQRLRRLLTRLLDIYSPSGKEEETVDYLYPYLKRKGLPVERQPVDENRDNLVVTLGQGDPALALIGHLDTVTAYDLDDFGAWTEGDRIHGLGAADMKSGCAAMIEAVLALVEDGRETPPLLLALVVGEEEEGDGARTLLREYHVPWAIIGEPTGLQPCLRHYGYMELQVATKGRRLHASLAPKGRNAVEQMLGALLELTKYFKDKRPELVYNIRDLVSAGSRFVVPDGCEAWIDVHLPAGTPPAEIIAEMEDLLPRETDPDQDLETTLHFWNVHDGFSLPERGRLIEALRSVFKDLGLPWTPQAFRSHSDANELWASGVRSVILGPGELEMAHHPEESVSFAQVLAAADLYYRTIRTWFPGI